MVFNLFKRFSSIDNSEVLPNPANYKGKRLYVGNEYKGVITHIGIKRGTREVTYFKVNNNGKEETVSLNGRKIVQSNKGIVISGEGDEIGLDELIKKIVISGEGDEIGLDELINKIDNEIQAIKNNEETIHKAVERLIIKKDLSNEDINLIREYINHTKREKEEAINRCKELLMILSNKIDKVKAILSSSELEAKELELRKEINGKLEPEEENKLKRIRASINEKMELLGKLYIKQREYERWCSG